MALRRIGRGSAHREMSMSARVGLLSGDACGIGPEITARLLASDALELDVATVVIADRRILQRGAEAADIALELPTIAHADAAPAGSAALLPGPPIDPEAAPVGQVSALAGKAALDGFRMALGLAEKRELDAICFAPCNKQALHQGGLELEDELRFFVQVLGFEGYVGEVNATDELATTRVTSHVPLRAVADLITEKRVLQAIRLARDTLRAAGQPHPKIAVAGLNPHAGDGGIFGREEIDVIAPAVERARAEQIAASGPYPSDTVFVRAQGGAFDAVVTMYHDQGQIAMKLMGFERGITIHAGLPFPITTPAHGTAFDIAGRGVARVDGLAQAYRTACRMALAAPGSDR
jgi:4-hydroxythreonine-4-phosphate dehydrogenase